MRSTEGDAIDDIAGRQRSCAHQRNAFTTEARGATPGDIDRHDLDRYISMLHARYKRGHKEITALGEMLRFARRRGHTQLGAIESVYATTSSSSPMTSSHAAAAVRLHRANPP